MPDRRTWDNEKTRDFLKGVVELFHDANRSDQDERALALKDLQFRNGEQWPDKIKQEREADGRPCLVINRMPGYSGLLTGAAKRSKPGIRLAPVDTGTDVEKTRIMEGLIRNIQNTSDAQIAFQWSHQMAVDCGRGFHRVVTDYADPMSFDQEIRIAWVQNPFSVIWDQNGTDWFLNDAEWMSQGSWMLKSTIERKWPHGVTAAGFEVPTGDELHWMKDDGKVLRVMEWFRKERESVPVYLVQIAGEDMPKAMLKKELEGLDVQNQVLTQAMQPMVNYNIIQERQTEIIEIQRYLLTYDTILEGPTVWPSKYYPFIPCWGKMTNVNGRQCRHGIIRPLMDMQRMLNYWDSKETESIALQPDAPFMATEKQVGGHQGMWNALGNKPQKYILYTPDMQAPGIPQRIEPPVLSQAIHAAIESAGMRMDEISGLYPASRGQASNETAGIAIRERKEQGDTSNFDYFDNLGLSITQTGRVISDLAPVVYDRPERVVQILGPDGARDLAVINAADGTNDIRLAKHDVVFESGQDMKTARRESLEEMDMLMKSLPQELVAQFADLIVQDMDLKEKTEIAERIRQYVAGVQQVQAMEQEQAMVAAQGKAAGGVPQNGNGGKG